MSDEDTQYIKQFEDEGGMGKFINDYWDVVEIFVDFLRLFYEMITRIYSSLYPTFNTFCKQICKVKEKLDQMCRSDQTRREMELRMKAKYDKYWGDMSRIDIFLYVVVVLDPNIKLMIWCIICDWRTKRHELIILRNGLGNPLADCLMSLPRSMDGNILAPIPTTLPPPEVRMEKKYRLECNERLE